MTQIDIGTTRDRYDWSRFDVYMDFFAPPEQVYDAWATAAGMAGFFTREFVYRDPEGEPREKTERAVAGDTYELEFHHPLRLSGRVIDCEPDRRFSFSFPTIMTVTIELEPLENGTRLHLRQSEIMEDETSRVEQHLNCRSCWIYYLMNLKSVLQGGPDLRDDPNPVDNPVSVHFHRMATAYQES